MSVVLASRRWLSCGSHSCRVMRRYVDEHHEFGSICCTAANNMPGKTLAVEIDGTVKRQVVALFDQCR